MPATAAADDLLPMLHRTLKLPKSVWSATKRRGKREGKPARWIISDALDVELIPLIDALRELGLNDQHQKERKLVRLPIDDHVVALLNHGRRRTGIPGVCLLTLCLHRYACRSK